MFKFVYVINISGNSLLAEVLVKVYFNYYIALIDGNGLPISWNREESS